MVSPQTVDNLMTAAKAVGYGEIPPYESSECVTIGAFDLIVIHSANKDWVFELLQAICAKYESVKGDAKFLSGYIYMLGQLAAASDTTELPEGLRRIITENPTQTGELQDWYRLKS